MAKKRYRTVGYSQTIRMGKNPDAPKIHIKAKSKRALAAKLRTVRAHTKNVEMGFTDATGFHPIRSSSDYKPYRAGEFPKQGKSTKERKAASRRAKARMHSGRARKGRQTVS